VGTYRGGAGRSRNYPHILLPFLAPNICDGNGNSALHIAVQETDNIAVIERLVIHPRIQINWKNTKGRTPLESLADKYPSGGITEENLAYMRTLIRAGADTRGIRSEQILCAVAGTINAREQVAERFARFGETFIKYFLLAPPRQ
jgi:hypothetical protein